jgi:hypothetical protein
VLLLYTYTVSKLLPYIIFVEVLDHNVTGRRRSAPGVCGGNEGYEKNCNNPRQQTTIQQQQQIMKQATGIIIPTNVMK